MDPVKEIIELYLTWRELNTLIDSRGRMDPVKEIIELYLTRRKNTLILEDGWILSRK